jgi:hypothetical protein
MFKRYPKDNGAIVAMLGQEILDVINKHAKKMLANKLTPQDAVYNVADALTTAIVSVVADVERSNPGTDFLSYVAQSLERYVNQINPGRVTAKFVQDGPGKKDPVH